MLLPVESGTMTTEYSKSMLNRPLERINTAIWLVYFYSFVERHWSLLILGWELSFETTENNSFGKLKCSVQISFKMNYRKSNKKVENNTNCQVKCNKNIKINPKI